jgi:uncharacterized protein YigE (DUF2233 family)
MRQPKGIQLRNRLERLVRQGRRVGLALLAPALLGLAPPTSALECSQLVFRDTPSTVCRVDLRKDRLQLFLKDSAGAPIKSLRRLAEVLQGQAQQLLFAMNAGMFREDYSPLGLLVVDGQQLHRINLATGFGNFYMKPNGVFVVSPSGARIVESSQYAALQDQDLVILATQSGPLLLTAGTIHPGLNPEGTSRNIRNGIGVVSPNEVVFAISEEPVNFYEFALLFRDRLKCSDALYLDGNVSSLYARGLGRDDEHTSLGPIIGVTAPLTR